MRNGSGEALAEGTKEIAEEKHTQVPEAVHVQSEYDPARGGERITFHEFMRRDPICKSLSPRRERTDYYLRCVWGVIPGTPARYITEAEYERQGEAMGRNPWPYSDDESPDPEDCSGQTLPFRLAFAYHWVPMIC